MLRGNPPPPPPTSLFFLFLSISFPSLFKKKSENFGGGLNPLNPPLKYALDYMPYYEYEVNSAIFCIIRPVPDVSRLFY